MQISPLFSKTFPDCSQLFHSGPLFSQKFPLCSFNFEQSFFVSRAINDFVSITNKPATTTEKKTQTPPQPH
jgi:hypothetical protein